MSTLEIITADSGSGQAYLWNPLVVLTTHPAQRGATVRAPAGTLTETEQERRVAGVAPYRPDDVKTGSRPGDEPTSTVRRPEEGRVPSPADELATGRISALQLEEPFLVEIEQTPPATGDPELDEVLRNRPQVGDTPWNNLICLMFPGLPLCMRR